MSLEKTATDGHYRLLVTEKENAIAEENLLDGHYFIQTEVKENQLSESEVIAAYKSLQKVERIFKVLKNNIELRPKFVRNEYRIRGHIVICFFTYLIECILERTLAELLPGQSMERFKIELARIKLVPVKLSNRITSRTDKLYFVTGGSKDIQRFYSAIKIRNFRHPENLYFSKKGECTGNFSNQLSLFPIFSIE